MSIVRRLRHEKVVFELLRLKGHGRLEAIFNIIRGRTYGKCMYHPRRIRAEMRYRRLSSTKVY
jgi:hypothetical protein